MIWAIEKEGEGESEMPFADLVCVIKNRLPSRVDLVCMPFVQSTTVIRIIIIPPSRLRVTIPSRVNWCY